MISAITHKISIVIFAILFLYPLLLLAENIPLTKKGGVYEVPVEVNGVITLKFILDTGAAEVNIPADVALTLYRAGTITDTDFLPGQTYKLGDGSLVQNARFILRSLKIGKSRITNVPASIGNISSSLLLGQSFLNKLGSWGFDNKKNVLTINSDDSVRVTQKSEKPSVSPDPQIIKNSISPQSPVKQPLEFFSSTLIGSWERKQMLSIPGIGDSVIQEICTFSSDGNIQCRDSARKSFHAQYTYRDGELSFE